MTSGNDNNIARSTVSIVEQDEGDIPTHIVISNSNHDTHVPLHDVIGISIEIRCELMRDSVDGTLLIVLKQDNYETKFWRKWLRVVLKIIVYFLSVCYIFGLFTGAICSIICCVLVIFNLQRGLPKVDDNAGCLRPAASRKVFTSHVPLPRYITMILSGNVIAALIVSLLRFLAGVPVLSAALSFASSNTTAFLCIILTMFLYALFIIWPLPLPISGYVYRYLGDSMVVPAPPSPVFPISVAFDQDTIHHLVMLRKQLYASPVLRGLVLDRWVANASVESALVYALPSHIYNSPAFRHIMFLLVNYVIPFYSVIRGVGALVPHLTTLSFLLRADVGLNFMMGFFDFYSRRAAQLMVNSLFYVAARVPLHDHVVSITRPINSRLQPVMFALGRGMYLLHRFVFAYLIPNNIFFQYLQNQFVLLQYTFGQIWSQSYGVVSYAFTNLRSSGAQLVSVMSMFLVKPLPAPNVMQVTSNVVHGGMTLVKAIAVSPDASNRSLGLKSAGGDGPVLVMRERKSGRRMADDTREMQKSIDRDSSQAQSPIRLAGDLISPVGSPESLPTLLDEFDLLPAEESAEATATQL